LVLRDLRDQSESLDQLADEECLDLMVPGDRREAPGTEGEWADLDRKGILEMLANPDLRVFRV